MPYFQNVLFADCVHVARKLASKQSEAKNNILNMQLHISGATVFHS